MEQKKPGSLRIPSLKRAWKGPWPRAARGPIGDTLARQVEHHCGKPAGWLHEEREPTGPTAAEQQFLALALKTYRATHSDGRKRLGQSVKAFGSR